MESKINNMVFSLGDLVHMKLDNDLPAIITGILYAEGGIEYRLARFCDEERKTDWVYASEIYK